MKIDNQVKDILAQQQQVQFNQLSIYNHHNGMLPVINASRYALIIQTLLAATIVSFIKFFLNRYTSFQGYVSISDLGLMYTGLFFITGILFGMVNQDLKQAEKMPSEMACNLQQLQDFFYILIKTSKSIPNGSLPTIQIYKKIMKVANTWKESLQQNYEIGAQTLIQLNEIIKYAYVLDKSGGSIVCNILNVVDKIRRISQRSYSLSRVHVLPGAHGLAQFFVLASTVMLFFVKYTNQATQLLIMICVYTVTWFAVRMVSFIDDPFQDQVFLGWQGILGSNRLVHLFIIDEYALRVLHRSNVIDKSNNLVDTKRIDVILKDELKRKDISSHNITNLALSIFESILNQNSLYQNANN